MLWHLYFPGGITMPFARQLPWKNELQSRTGIWGWPCVQLVMNSRPKAYFSKGSEQ